MTENTSFMEAFLKAARSFSSSIPVLLGVILLMGLFRAVVSREILSRVFSGDPLYDTFIGSLIGSLSAGNAITSYIIGGELLGQGVSLFAVTAFIVAWVTVGVIQIPAEAALLGRKFAVARNLVSFFLAFLVSLATVLTLMVMK
jgi:uncharacterized membrane protein YraQ (UPF0718 family)